ncbi:hypothetical protein C922_02383 [Plasmodium inui San Antonio 1]|uniref:Uncharacterized protein n=1 Tax=Plasmodium inui San Antonio 1 TaxID=1237626 RepID=W7A7G2_9APIC|nr:hypothetical protein C922_02383 [Plasmodium inui San Antonio 1]EUD67233.1 hypothetical protein C922_02383 [Plasmodium inui San Antonio 1]
MSKKIENPKVLKLAERLVALKQDEIDHFTHLFKERIAAKPKFSQKPADEIEPVHPHTKRLPNPGNFNHQRKHIIFNFYFNLFQTIRNTFLFVRR